MNQGFKQQPQQQEIRINFNLAVDALICEECGGFAVLLPIAAQPKHAPLVGKDKPIVGVSIPVCIQCGRNAVTGKFTQREEFEAKSA